MLFKKVSRRIILSPVYRFVVRKSSTSRNLHCLGSMMRRLPVKWLSCRGRENPKLHSKKTRSPQC